MWRTWVILVVASACGGDARTTHGADGAPRDGAGPGGDGGGGVDAPPGEVCGGIIGLTCPAGFFCDFAENDCGAGDVQGTCQPQPAGCPDPISEDVCGCDGQVYSIPCDAYAAGIDLGPAAGCTAPSANHFACGDRFCQQGATYCEVLVSDVAGVPNEYRCVTWPATCGAMGNTACACFASERCGAMCQEPEMDRFTLTCPGG